MSGWAVPDYERQRRQLDLDREAVCLKLLVRGDEEGARRLRQSGQRANQAIKADIKQVTGRSVLDPKHDELRSRLQQYRSVVHAGQKDAQR